MKNLLPAMITGIVRMSCAIADILSSISRPNIDPIDRTTTWIENTTHITSDINIDLELSSVCASFLTTVYPADVIVSSIVSLSTISGSYIKDTLPAVKFA